MIRGSHRPGENHGGPGHSIAVYGASAARTSKAAAVRFRESSQQSTQHCMRYERLRQTDVAVAFQDVLLLQMVQTLRMVKAAAVRFCEPSQQSTQHCMRYERLRQINVAVASQDVLLLQMCTAACRSFSSTYKPPITQTYRPPITQVFANTPSCLCVHQGDFNTTHMLFIILVQLDFLINIC